MGKTVLVVEDDQAIREALTMMLELDGHRVIVAENGAEGLARLQALADEPCLILLDLFMPVMDGASFLEHLRANPQHAVASIPVVLVSAASSNDARLKQAIEKASGYIKKPINLEQIDQVVKDFCCRH